MKLTSTQRSEIIAAAFQDCTGGVAPYKSPWIYSLGEDYIAAHEQPYNDWRISNDPLIDAVLAAVERVVEHKTTDPRLDVACGGLQDEA